jgi:RNA polymerase-binding transcription factor DksA
MFERLTARSPKNGMAYLVNVKQNEQVVESPYPNTLRCIMDSFNRLAAYEDSGLSPDEVQELAKAKADGRMVERGTWINGYCSNCNSPIPTDNKDDYIAKNECRFCYYCGAKMEEAAEKALEVRE